MTRWCSPQSRTRLASEVGPPSAQWVMWWAWHIEGGLVQPGKAQCWSRRIRAIQIGRGDQSAGRPTSRTCPSAPRTPGMIWAWQARRRTAATESSSPVSVCPAGPRRCCSASRVVVTTTRGRVPCDSGGSSVSRACWAVSIRASHIRAPWSRGSRSVAQVGSSGSSGRCGFGQGEQGGADHLAVLGRAVAPEPDAAGAVADHGQEPLQVRGAFLAVQRGLGGALGTVGVDHRGEVPAGPDQLGRGQGSGLLEQDLLGLGTQRRVGGQRVDRLADDPGLRQRRVARTAPPPGSRCSRRSGHGRAGPGAARRGGTPRSGG